MRTLEIAVVAMDAVVLLLTVFRLPPRWWQAASKASSMRRRWLRAEPVLLAVLLLPLLAHLVIERHRFVMIPAYAVTVALGCVLLTRWFRWARRTADAPRRRRPVLRVLGRITAMMVGALALAVSSAAGFLLPVFKLPTPTGPYAVGYTEEHLTDSSRQ